VYLKDHSPYLDSSLFYSKSQNIIRVNELGNYSTSYIYVVNYSIPYIDKRVLKVILRAH